MLLGNGARHCPAVSAGCGPDRGAPTELYVGTFTARQATAGSFPCQPRRVPVSSFSQAHPAPGHGSLCPRRRPSARLLAPHLDGPSSFLVEFPVPIFPPLDHSASNDKRDVEKMQTRARRGRPAAPKGLRCTLNNTQGLAWPTGPAPACLARPPPPALTAWSHWPFQSSDRPSSYPWHFITWPLVSRLGTAGARGLTAWPEDSSPSLCREPALS